jgi:hypothetical protein
MLEAIGDLYLDNVRFTTDPKTYARQWAKRITLVPTIGGNTVLDFGRKAKDIKLELAGSDGQWMARDVFDAIDTRAGTLGVPYAFRDWLGTEATVVIAAFDGDEFLPDLFTYSLTLWVRALAKLRGVAYGGA